MDKVTAMCALFLIAMRGGGMFHAKICLCMVICRGGYVRAAFFFYAILAMSGTKLKGDDL